MKKNSFICSTINAILMLNAIFLTMPANGFDSKLIKEARDIKDVHQVVVNGSGQLTLKQGIGDELTIEAPLDSLKNITSRVKDNTLYLEQKNSALQAQGPVHYYLTLKNIEGINTSGDCAIVTGNLKTPKLSINLSGNSSIDLKVKADLLATRISGSGALKSLGSVKEQTIDISGSGNFQGDKLIALVSNIIISGSGTASTRTQKTLTVKIEGAGTVRYYGTPKITQQISGSGEIVPL